MIGILYIAYGLSSNAEVKIKEQEVNVLDYISETHNNIHSIELSACGDLPDTTFIEVRAMYNHVAKDTWYRVRNAINTELWFNVD